MAETVGEALMGQHTYVIVPAESKATYLIGYLGLDCARLKERRKQHARNLTDVLRDATDTDIVDLLRQDYLEPNADGRLKPFHSLSKAILEP